MTLDAEVATFLQTVAWDVVLAWLQTNKLHILLS